MQLRREAFEKGVITQEEIDASAERIVKLCEFVEKVFIEDNSVKDRILY